MRPLIDEELSSAEARHFLRLGENRIWTMFMQGNHMFGKIATSTPLDFIATEHHAARGAA